MGRYAVITKLLAVAGTALAWFPILATVFITAAGSFTGRVFRLDYLLPAELFPVAVAGGALLLWAALRSRSRRRLIGWNLALMLGSLAGGQALAVTTGLASGETQPEGWAWTLVVGSIVAYTLALLAIDIGGLLLLRDLFRNRHEGGAPVVPTA